MKYKQGKPTLVALDVAVHTLAQMVIDHLELFGYVIIKRPPLPAHSIP